MVLKEKGVLWPGNPEIAAKYREKIYYFSGYEAREKFVREPAAFLSQELQPKKPPCTRLIILGPRGSGKTTHGKYLADKLGLFHISFRHRLQEIIMPKLRRKIGPEFKEGHEFDWELKRQREEEKQRITLETATEAGEFRFLHFLISRVLKFST